MVEMCSCVVGLVVWGDAGRGILLKALELGGGILLMLDLSAAMVYFTYVRRAFLWESMWWSSD